MDNLTKQEILDVLSEVHDLLILKENWSAETSCLKDKEEVDVIDATQWSFLGAIEKVLLSHNKYPFLNQVVSEIEKDCQQTPLCSFEERHEHIELVEYLYSTMGRLADELNLNMYVPFFPVTENFKEDCPLFFISKEFDEELERSYKEQETKYEHARFRDAEAMRFDRE